MRPRRVTWIKTKREGVKSGFSGALKPGRLGLGFKVNKCCDVWIWDLGVQTTHETSPRLNPLRLNATSRQDKSTPFACHTKKSSSTLSGWPLYLWFSISQRIALGFMQHYINLPGLGSRELTIVVYESCESI